MADGGTTLPIRFQTADAFKKVLPLLDWFIPDGAFSTRSDQQLARFFVFTHLCGPLLAVPMGFAVMAIDPDFSIEAGLVIASIASFTVLPLVVKWRRSIWLASLMSFQQLAFAALYGSYHYGGMTSPFMPWVVVALLLGFFYHPREPRLIIGLFLADLALFIGTLRFTGAFPERVPADELQLLGWLSIIAATVYMSWMATYYVRIVSMHDDFEAEARRHRRAAEELDRIRTLAEQTNARRETFFTKMSHELRTPLNAVIGYSDLLHETFEDREDREGIEDAGRIHAAGKHLMSLVTDVIDRSRVEDGSVQLAVGEFEVCELLNEVSASTMHLVRKNGNNFVIECPNQLAKMKSDQTKLRQILINLVSNAAKFTENGTVTVSAKAVTDATGQWMDFTVRDTGIGIAESAIGKLFGDFVQADASVSSKFGGTGLGLSLCRKFCLLLGGTIEVSSRLGEGSAFKVQVPLAIEDTQPVAQEEATTADVDADGELIDQTFADADRGALGR